MLLISNGNQGWLCLFFILIIQIGILTKYIIIVMNVVLPFIREK